MEVTAYCLEGGKVISKAKELPPPDSYEIQIRGILTGICGSDTAVYAGKEQYLGDEMWGHEGVGEVVAVGDKVSRFNAGRYVATYWHPTFWTYYNVPQETAVAIRQPMPEMILQPLACPLSAIQQRSTWRGEDVLVIGSGFMSYLWVRYLGDYFMYMSPTIRDVLCENNQSIFKNTAFSVVDRQHVAPDSYDVVVMCSVNAAQKDYYDLAVQAAKIGGTIVNYTTPRACVSTNFFRYNWKNLTMTFPSPRWPGYSLAFRESAKYAELLKLSCYLKHWDISQVNEAFEYEAKKKAFSKSYIRMAQA